MPNAAELFVMLIDKISPPEFCAELLMRTDNPEGFEIYNKLLNTTVEYPSIAPSQILTPDRYAAIQPATLHIGKDIDQKFLDKCIKIATTFVRAQVGDQSTLDSLIEIIGDSNIDWEIRRDAASHIRLLLNQGVLNESFIKKHLITDERLLLSEEVTIKAIESLIKLLKSDNPSVREWVIFALGTRTDLNVVNSLIEMIYDENPVIRRKASIQLGMIKNPRAVELLITLLDDDNEDVRLYSAQSLGLIGDPRAIKSLIKLTESEPDIRVKGAIFDALSTIGGKAIEFLIRLFENNEQDIEDKIMVVASLARRGNRNAMKFLEKLFYDFEMDVQRAVAYILGGLGNPIVIDTMIGFLKNQEIVEGLLEDETEKESEGWRIEHRILGEFFKKYPDIVKNALVNALEKGEIDEDSVEKVLASANIRNPEAYLQYFLKKGGNNSSYIPSLTSLNKVSDCCKADLKIGEPAIAIKSKGEKSIHALSCPEVKPAYWSY